MKQFLIGGRTKIAGSRYFLSYRAQQLAHYFITCWIRSAWNAHRLSVHIISADIGRHHYHLCTRQPILFVCPSGTQDTSARANGATLLDFHTLTPIIQKQQYLRRNMSPMHSPLPHAHHIFTFWDTLHGHAANAQLSHRHTLPVQHLVIASASRFCFLHGSMYT